MSAVAEWPVPKVERIIHGSSKLLSSLHQRVCFHCTTTPFIDGSASKKKKQVRPAEMPFEERWDENFQQAFDTLKELTTAQLLAYPDFTQPFIVETDASFKGLGAVLSQHQQGKLRVIA